MKKLTFIFITMLFTLVIDQTYAQIAKNIAKNNKKSESIALRKLEAVKVNDASKLNFNTDFGNSGSVTWFRTEKYDEAIFMKDAHEMNAYYDNTGQLVGTTSLKTFSELPAKGQDNLNILFRNYTIEQIVYYTSNPNNKTPMVLWGSVIDNNTQYLVQMKYGFRHFIVYMDTNGTVSLFKVL